MKIDTGSLPDMSVDRRLVPVDVFDDGSFKVGNRGQPALGALFQFNCEALFVLCEEDFHPRCGDRVATMYRAGQHFSSREMNFGGRLFHVELCGDDSSDGLPNKYVLCITEQVKNPALRETVTVAEIYSVYRQVLMELTRRGYRRVWAK